MRYILFSIVFLIVACGSKTESASPQPNNIESNTKKTVAPSDRDYNVDSPILGGPADFSIKVTDLTGPTKINLIASYVDQNYIADTSIMNGGVIKFKNEKGYPQGLYFVSLPNQKYIQVLLAEDQKFSMECSSADIVNSMKVSGSIDNDLYYKTAIFEAGINPRIQTFNDRMQQTEKGTDNYENAKKMRKELEDEREAYLLNIAKDHPGSLFANFKIGGQNPKLREDIPSDQQVTQYRKDFWSMVDFTDRRLLHTPMIGNKLKRYMTELTAQNPDSIISSATYLVDQAESYPEYFKVFTNWIVKQFEPTKTTLMDPEAVFVNMIQKYFTLEKAFWADTIQVNALQGRAHEMAQSLVNGPAPNVISKDQFGNTQDLLSKKADYLVVYMFNPDCEHCQEQTPKLIDFYNKNKKEVDVMAIAIETTDQEWKKYIKKVNMPFTTVHDPSNRSIYAKYYVDITPELYVINPERKIIGKNLKVFQIQTVIDRDKEQRKK